uniref:U3 small nucleolar RNA-associated protein 13 C-terminal domain-containing protein n=1 Tax=Glossina palpalis gambiensis TaxID=67801 RepID=A0A1B0BDR2_9MUSC
MSTVEGEKKFTVDTSYTNFYTGGDVAWSNDGQYIYCMNGNAVNLVEIVTGLVKRTYGLNANINTEGDKAFSEEDEDVIYSFALAPRSDYLLTAHRSSLLRLWHLEDGKVKKLWKSQHKGPIVKVAFNPDCRLVCSSGGDSSLRIWDYENSRCLAAFKDFSGPSYLVHFHPNAFKTEIFAAGSDNSIYCWNFHTKELICKMSGHISQVTAFCFANRNSDCEFMASVGRDKVLIIWRLNGTQEKVIPIYDELEGAFYANEREVIVAGTKGDIKLVKLKSGKISLLNESRGEYEIKHLLRNDVTQQLAAVTVDHNILIFERDAENQSLNCIKQLIGFNDEILDITFLGESERFLAMATNSKHIKLYDCEKGMNCKIIPGHTDTVMCLSTPGLSNMLLSAGKDFAIILWQLNIEECTLHCMAKNVSSHTAAIGCISFAYECSKTFASVCQSGILKVWNLKEIEQKGGEFQFNIKHAAIAHDKEVNCVTYSPNNKIIATASQDKLAKLWSAETFTSLGILRGHSRGVWCVRFSPVDQIAVTSSSDCSLRIWSLANLSCLKRLEHSSTVLKAEFLHHGRYIISTSSDGLLKLWSIKTSTCIQTMEGHDDRVWSLAMPSSSKMHFFSAAADSKLIKWRDITEEVKNTEIDNRQQQLLQEQSLQNLLNESKNTKKAFILALKLGKPKVSYKIINEYIRKRDYSGMEEIVSALDTDQRRSLLDHAKMWITNSRYSQASNLILKYLLAEMLVDPGLQRSLNSANLVEVLTPYTQRHFKRLTALKTDLNYLDFLVQNI